MSNYKPVMESLCEILKGMDKDALVTALNEIRAELHSISPFKDEPVDLVLWVKNETVSSNDYNPNTVAAPEMELLRLSVESDGYTQPIVAWEESDEDYEVVDGFHRNLVGRTGIVQERIFGYLPIVKIKSSRQERGDRIASTIRHNRARGKHGVSSMSEIVVELKRRNWSDKKIGKELGMDPDEVLRLSQITGLAELFADRDFSEAWDAANPFEDGQYNGVERIEDCSEMG